VLGGGGSYIKCKMEKVICFSNVDLRIKNTLYHARIIFILIANKVNMRTAFNEEWIPISIRIAP